MAIISTLTVGTNTYSVYALTADPLADATSYIAALLDTSNWDDATSTNKKKALVSAARLMDRAILWSGSVTTPGQARAWPRDGATDGCAGEAIADGTTPDAFVDAQAELALALLGDSSILSSTGTGTNTRRVKAGSAEVEFFQPTAGTSDETRLPQQVHDLVACYQDGSGGITPSSGSLSSGTGDSTSFDADGTGPNWDPNQGYA